MPHIVPICDIVRARSFKMWSALASRLPIHNRANFLERRILGVCRRFVRFQPILRVARHAA